MRQTACDARGSTERHVSLAFHIRQYPTKSSTIPCYENSRPDFHKQVCMRMHRVGDPKHSGLRQSSSDIGLPMRRRDRHLRNEGQQVACQDAPEEFVQIIIVHPHCFFDQQEFQNHSTHRIQRARGCEERVRAGAPAPEQTQTQDGDTGATHVGKFSTKKWIWKSQLLYENQVFVECTQRSAEADHSSIHVKTEARTLSTRRGGIDCFDR